MNIAARTVDNLESGQVARWYRGIAVSLHVERAIPDPLGCTSALYVYVIPAGTWLGYIEVLSIEYRRVRTADIMDSWAWQLLGSWIWRTLGVATPRDGVEY